MVATIGNPSGMAATARAIAVSIIRRIPLPRMIPAAAIMAIMTKVTQIKFLPNRSSRFSSGVAVSSACSTSEEIWPSSVFIPVATTRASAEPRVNAVPLYSMLRRSARSVSCPTGEVCLPTGMDSPVRTDSSTCNLETCASLISALTISPPSSTTISPGTRSRAAISSTCPARRTRAVIRSIRWSDSIDRTAFNSIRKPIAVLTAMTAAIAPASIHS